MSEAIGNEQIQNEQLITHDFSPDHTLLLTDKETEALEQLSVERIDISPEDIHAITTYVSTTPRMSAEKLFESTNPEDFLGLQIADPALRQSMIARFSRQFPGLPKLSKDEAEAVFNHLSSVGLVGSAYTKKRGQLVEQLGAESTPQTSKVGKFLGKLAPKATVKEVSKQSTEYYELNRHRIGTITGKKNSQIAKDTDKAEDARELRVENETKSRMAGHERRQKAVDKLAEKRSFHLNIIPNAKLESQRQTEVEDPIDDSLHQGDLLSMMRDLQPQAESTAKHIHGTSSQVLESLYNDRDSSDKRSKEQFFTEEADDVREALINQSPIAEKDLIRDELSKLDKAQDALQQQESRHETERIARMSPLEKYHYKFNKVLDLMDDPKYGHIFDKDRLVQLHKDIQRAAFPLYKAELENMKVEIENTNARIEKANRLLPDDQQKPLEKEPNSFNDIPAHKRGQIVEPIDQKYTERYLGTGTPSDIAELVTFARLVATGKIKEPTEEKPKK